LQYCNLECGLVFKFLHINHLICKRDVWSGLL
jgi:hypothetical protein